MVMASNAVVYCRFSPRPKDKADTTETLELQEERSRDYCRINGLDVVAVCTDSEESGAKLLHQRPGGKQLIKLVGGRTAGNVVVLKSDRLYRDAAQCLLICQKWSDMGVRLHLAHQGGVSADCATPLGKMVLTMLAGFDEFTRATICDNTRQAMQRYQRNGRVMGGQAPYGWMPDMRGELRSDGRPKTMTKNLKEQETLSLIKAKLAEGKNTNQIAEELNKEKRFARSGGPWYAKTISRIKDRLARDEKTE